MQRTDQFNGVRVADCQGRRIGRVVGAHPGDTPFTVDWLVVQARWRGRRALPADLALPTMTGLHVQLPREDILNSPLLSASWSATPVEWAVLEDYYAQSSLVAQ